MSLPEQTPPPAIGEPPRRLWRGPVLAGLLVVVLAALTGGAVAHFAWPPSSSSPSAGSGFPFRRVFPRLTPSQNPSGSAAASSTTTDSLAAQVDPGLVDI